ncbi:hypothetical protein DPMN_186630 [Dreissena polymorpha]|uniref:Uncharacterized protein n=1 Tax=Dreissena polymorpha TaxID=45954 RepID=A0A9D4I9R3_DREPO|nr:hypothetical protein DPMN_186630 [Dreissena polymorpha]
MRTHKGDPLNLCGKLKVRGGRKGSGPRRGRRSRLTHTSLRGTFWTRSGQEPSKPSNHSDASRKDALGSCDCIEPAASPEVELITSEPTLGKVKDVITIWFCSWT